MISAILLAAGQSKRMNGENKLLKKIYNTPLINHSVRNILSSAVDELIIVLGYDEDILKKKIIKSQKIKFAFNKDFKTGMSSSIKIGLENLSEKCEAFFISLGDMPLVSDDIYNKIIKLKDNKKIVVPTYKGQQGNPIMFPKFMKKKIMIIEGDVGAKKILLENKNDILNLQIDDDSIIRDFNIKENFNI